LSPGPDKLTSAVADEQFHYRRQSVVENTSLSLLP
jgi:hypothetical protein